MTLYPPQLIEKLDKGEIPTISVKWVRDYDNIDYNRPNTFLCVGMRGCGKSSTLEALACRYPKIIDLFGSKDNESLSWCKPESPYHDVLFIIGDNVTINSKFPTVNINKLTLKDIEQYQVIITCHAFYNTRTEYLVSIQVITNMLWEKRNYWTEPWALVIREAASWIYSRLQVVKDSNMAKADFINMLREARHSGVAVLVDTIRWTSLDKEVRDVSDYIFLKRVGAIGLPKDLHFIYKYVNPHAMMKLWKGVFVIMTTTGAIGFGKFDKPKWHKEENENILALCGIDITYLDPDRINAQSGSNVTPGEHAQIIRAYKETRSMGKVAARLSRSKDTIQRAVSRHNTTIQELGYCLECHNVKEPLESEKLKREKGIAVR